MSRYEKIDEAFEHEEVEEARSLVGEFEFKLRGVSTPIHIRLYRMTGSDKIWWEQSHYLKTPLQADPYRTSSPWADTAEEALQACVRRILLFYRPAINKGHKPNNRWLVKNKFFKP